MADNNQAEATRDLRAAGMGTYKPPDVLRNRWGQPLFQDSPGRPDMFVFRGEKMTFVEVKNGAEGFEMKRMQRNKIDYYHQYIVPIGMRMWLWLTIGTGQPHWNPSKMPRKTWLLPFEVYLATEAKIAPHNGILPYLVGKNHKLILRQNQWDAIHLFAEYELHWQSRWVIPDTHLFHRLYLGGTS